MAILLGSIAVLGELARLGRRSGSRAVQLTEAQLLCESLLAEVLIGSAPAEATEPQPVPQVTGWLYSIEREPVDVPGLVSLRVTVVQDLPPEQRPLSFSLSRWLREGGASVAPAAGGAAGQSGRGAMP